MTTKNITRLTVRVYGLLMNDKGEVLISDEKIRGRDFTKFPGGGLELGESVWDCVLREFKEETGLDVEIVKHIYTTDFFVRSTFHEQVQVLSIYYQVNCSDFSPLLTTEIPFDFHTGSDGMLQCFRWKKLSDLSMEDLSFETDQRALHELKQLF